MVGNAKNKENKMYGRPYLAVWYKLFELEKIKLITTNDVLLCSLIHSWHTNSKQFCCKQTNLALAKTLNITTETVCKCINGDPNRKKRTLGLEKLGLITYTGRGKDRVMFSNLSEELIDKIIEKYGKIPNEPKDESSQPKDESGKLSGQPKDESSQPKDESSQPPVLSLSYNNTNESFKNNLMNNKEEGNTPTPIFNSLSRSKKDSVETIFDFWNFHKKSGRWQKHKKLTKDMVEAILTSLKDYSLEDICGAINNYAKVLQNEKYYWDYIWPLSTFLTVKEGKHKDDPRKWWRWLEENFVEENFLTRYASGNSKQGSSRKLEELPPDPDPELTELIVDRYKYWYRPKGRDFPNFTARKHFILTTIKAKENYKLNTTIQKKNFVDEFFQIAQGVWSSKGEEVMPWDLSGTLMWDYKMPQYYQNMGIPESTIGQISENPLSESEFEIEKLPILGGKSECKEIGGDDCPELNHMLDV